MATNKIPPIYPIFPLKPLVPPPPPQKPGPPPLAQKTPAIIGYAPIFQLAPLPEVKKESGRTFKIPPIYPVYKLNPLPMVFPPLSGSGSDTVGQEKGKTEGKKNLGKGGRMKRLQMKKVLLIRMNFRGEKLRIANQILGNRGKTWKNSV